MAVMAPGPGRTERAYAVDSGPGSPGTSQGGRCGSGPESGRAKAV